MFGIIKRLLPTVFLVGLITLLGACSEEPLPEINVTGKIIYIQKHIGWNYPAHSVIQGLESKEVMRIAGVWGSVGDTVSIYISIDKKF